MRSIRHYVQNHGLTVDILAGPDWTVSEDGWEHHRYDLLLNNPEQGTTMVICGYTNGIGITEGPDEKPEEVIDALVSDSWGYENSDGFEDWADEHGIDTDSRKAERTYEAVKKQAGEFIDFIGGKPELEKLALHYERL